MLDNQMGTCIAQLGEPQPIPGLFISGSGMPAGKVLVYQPKADITPLELAHLVHMFLVLTTRGVTTYNVPEFLARHGLQRHFDTRESTS